jgi:hypothetical protein
MKPQKMALLDVLEFGYNRFNRLTISRGDLFKNGVNRFGQIKSFQTNGAQQYWEVSRR